MPKDFNNNPEGLFGNPLSFGCSDLRALRIIAEGINELNALAGDGSNIDAVAARVKTLDPVVKMALLTRFTEAWNEMVGDLATAEIYFHVFDASQATFFHDMLAQLEVVYKRVKESLQPEIEARLDAGFDAPWDPTHTPAAQPSLLSEEEDKRAALILQQLWDTRDDAHTKSLD